MYDKNTLDILNNSLLNHNKWKYGAKICTQNQFTYIIHNFVRINCSGNTRICWEVGYFSDQTSSQMSISLYNGLLEICCFYWLNLMYIKLGVTRNTGFN